MEKILYISVFSTFFLTAGLTLFLGLPSELVWNYNLYVFPLLFFFDENNFRPNLFWNRRLKIIIIIYCIIIFLGYAFHLDYFSGKSIQNLTAWVSISLTALYLIQLKGDRYTILKRIIIAFFIINSCFAIYERITFQIIFPQSDFLNEVMSGYWDSEHLSMTFRACSLLGHPLTNGQITSLLGAFILLSPNIKSSHKILLYILGLLAMFSFGARGATMIYFINFGIYYVFRYLRKDKIIPFILAIIALWIIVNKLFSFLLEFDFLGRYVDLFSKMSVLEELESDASTSARFLGLERFLKEDFISLFWGGLSPTAGEIGYLMILQVWGLFWGILKIFFELLICYKLVPFVPYYGKIMLFLAYAVIGNMNNNLFNYNIFLFFVLGSCVLLSNNTKK